MEKDYTWEPLENLHGHKGLVSDFEVWLKEENKRLDDEAEEKRLAKKRELEEFRGNPGSCGNERAHGRCQEEEEEDGGSVSSSYSLHGTSIWIHLNVELPLSRQVIMHLPKYWQTLSGTAHNYMDHV